MVRKAVGAAMKMDDRVPNTTPSIMANENERIESPPRMKIQSSTISVVTDVLMVRARVWFSESLNSCWRSRLGKRWKFSRTRSNTTTLSLIE